MTRWENWVHAIANARGQWLPGDPRGFRDHDHRVHSSGDYKTPPPSGEHARLHAQAQALVKRVVYFSAAHRCKIARALGQYLLAHNYDPRVIAVDAVHAHILFRCGDADAKRIIARAKQFASRTLSQALPGSIWAQGCHVVRVRGELHFHQVVSYIEKHREDGAALWEHPSIRARRVAGPQKFDSDL